MSVLEAGLAYVWFLEHMGTTFRSHYRCSECIGIGKCEFRQEAFDCFIPKDASLMKEVLSDILKEFSKSSDEGIKEYALARMKEWMRRTEFTHKQGERLRSRKEELV